MLSFRDYLVEAKGKVRDANYGLDNDSKGKLHEALVGHFLKHPESKDPMTHKPKKGETTFPMRPVTGNKEGAMHETDDSHARAEVQKHHDTLKHGSDHEHFEENWNYHLTAAKNAAEHIRNHLSEAGHVARDEKVTNVHWTSRQKDIERISGVKDKANKSDLVLETAGPSHVAEIDKKSKAKRTPQTKKFVGLSMKIHNKPGMSTISNPGQDSLTQHFGLEDHHLEGIHQKAMTNTANEIAKHGFHAGEWTNKANLHKELGKTAKGREAKKAAAPHRQRAEWDTAKTLRESMKDAHPHHVAKVMRSLANIEKTQMPTVQAATYGTQNNMSHHVDDPHATLHKLIEEHKDHLYVQQDPKDSKMVTFKGKGGVTIANLGIKYKSSTAFSSKIGGTFNGWGSTAAANAGVGKGKK